MANDSNAQQMLEDIKQALALYNKVAPEKMEIVPQGHKEDVNDVYVCVYHNGSNSNEMHVGLFKKINWSTSLWQPLPDVLPYYDAGSIFVGVNSNYVGMIKTHCNADSINRPSPIGTRIELGNNGNYVASCKIDKFMSFDDMRLIMVNEELIDNYDIGKATSCEQLEVLKYASSYYGLNKTFSRTKKITR